MARKIKPEDPAFAAIYDGDGSVGMSFRDYVVVKMMAALVVSGHFRDPMEAAERAYEYTDALLLNRENRVETEDIV